MFFGILNLRQKILGAHPTLQLVLLKMYTCTHTHARTLGGPRLHLGIGTAASAVPRPSWPPPPAPHANT